MRYMHKTLIMRSTPHQLDGRISSIRQWSLYLQKYIYIYKYKYPRSYLIRPSPSLFHTPQKTNGWIPQQLVLWVGSGSSHLWPDEYLHTFTPWHSPSLSTATPKIRWMTTTLVSRKKGTWLVNQNSAPAGFMVQIYHDSFTSRFFLNI